MNDTTPHTPGGIGAEELMVGNYLNYPNGDTFFEVIVYGFVYGKKYIWTDFDDQTPINELQPIPLTEGWLKKFGFKKYTDSLGEKLFRNNKILLTKDFSLRYSDTNDDWYYSTAIKIKYVHQLQNLYFALTQTHLTHVNQQH